MEAAAGTHARIIFPDAVSGAEQHLPELQKAMLDATPDCIKVLSLSGNLITMNKAGCIALGVSEDTGFGMSWPSLLPEEFRERSLVALRQAASGYSARFAGQSQSPDGTRYWDNLLNPVVDASGSVVSILCVSRDVTEKALLEQELKDAVAREKLLSREMQHRIKNLFCVVTGIISLSEKEAVRESAPETAVKILREKICALSRASDAVFSLPDSDGLHASRVELGVLIRSVLQPYGDRCRTIGEQQVSIGWSNTTTLALVMHELATNSVKYGALSTGKGNVAIDWAVADEGINLAWVENGGPTIAAPPTAKGFGTEMLDRIVRSQGGGIERAWTRNGLTARLHLPNPD